MSVGFAAAGTGGHIFPALAVADAMVDRGIAAEDIVFFGGDRLEATAVPEAGYALCRLPLQGLRRELSLANLRLPMVVAQAARMVRAEARRRRLQAMVGFGGYVTVPAGIGARRAGVPLFLHEQNAMPGLANRWMARFAESTFVAFPGAQQRLPSSRLVGNPLRPALTRFNRSALRPRALQRYGLAPDRPVLGVLGGSQGARVLNDAVGEIAARGGEFSILHLTGRQHAVAMTKRSEEASLRWIVVDFEDEMEWFYAASDLVISRSGALTISELAATATPAIVVPLAIGTADHQAANAEHLVAAGAAEMIAEADIEALEARARSLVDDSDRLTAMAAAAGMHARPNAAYEVADAVLAVTHG